MKKKNRTHAVIPRTVSNAKSDTRRTLCGDFNLIGYSHLVVKGAKKKKVIHETYSTHTIHGMCHMCTRKKKKKKTNARTRQPQNSDALKLAKNEQQQKMQKMQNQRVREKKKLNDNLSGNAVREMEARQRMQCNNNDFFSLK